MPLMVVTSNLLSFVGAKHPEPAHYPKGSIIDATSDEAKDLVDDGNASPAPTGAKVSTGLPITVDPVERDLRAKNFDAVKGAIAKPDGADEIRTPIAGTSEGSAMARRAASVPSEPIPGSKG